MSSHSKTEAYDANFHTCDTPEMVNVCLNCGLERCMPQSQKCELYKLGYEEIKWLKDRK